MATTPSESAEASNQPQYLQFLEDKLEEILDDLNKMQPELDEMADGDNVMKTIKDFVAVYKDITTGVRAIHSALPQEQKNELDLHSAIAELEEVKRAAGAVAQTLNSPEGAVLDRLLKNMDEATRTAFEGELVSLMQALSAVNTSGIAEIRDSSHNIKSKLAKLEVRIRSVEGSSAEKV